MEFTFLEATVPLRKEFRPNKDNTSIPDATPYPRVSKLTTHMAEAKDIISMYPLLQKHAGQGHCLLKGYLTQNLQRESRAGMCNHESRHQWVCLDLDDAQVVSVQAALDICNLGEYSHIIQYSASNGLPHKQGLSAHVFFALDGELTAEELGDWLLWLNFEYFPNQTVPRDYGATIKTVIDPAVARYTQILYIADPKFFPGVGDPHDATLNPRWELVTGKFKAIPASLIRSITPHPNFIKAKKNELLNSNRTALGLRKLSRSQLKPYKNTGQTICTAPIEARVTSEKKARNFVYINLNGGDSDAYYYPVDNPDILYNFKGEPLYYLKDLCPTYYARIQRNIKENSVKPDKDGVQVLALQNANNSKLYNVTIDHISKTIDMSITSEKGAQRHLREHRKPIPDSNLFEEVNFCFRPDLYDVTTGTTGFGLFTEPQSNEKILNTYNPPIIPKINKDASKIPKNVKKIINHVLSYDEECFENFINWLAYIVQKPRMTGTAWVITGEQGTGKGVLCTNICTPLFGSQNTNTVSAMNISGRFTEVTDNKIMIFLDEMRREQGSDTGNVKDKLKRLITEPYLQQEKKFEGQMKIRNFSNIIITSNENIPVSIDSGDRRFNVAPRQNVPLKELYGNSSIKLTHIIEEVLPEEVSVFYHYLLQYTVDINKVAFVISNSAKNQMIQGSTTTTEGFAHAYRYGDMDYFYDGLEDARENPEDCGFFPLDKENHINTLESLFVKYFDPLRDGEVNSFILNKSEFENLAKYFITQKYRSSAHFKTWAANVGLMYTREMCEVSQRIKPGVKFNSR